MNLPEGIDQETYKRAVMFATPWRPNQRCEKQTFIETLDSRELYKQVDDGTINWYAAPSKTRYCHCGATGLAAPEHDIPLPPLTDELLMACVAASLKRNRYALREIDKELVDDLNLDLAGAIIRHASRWRRNEISNRYEESY